MNTLILFLMLLSTIAVVATIHAIANGGRGLPPRSHTRDERFLPPSSLVH